MGVCVLNVFSVKLSWVEVGSLPCCHMVLQGGEVCHMFFACVERLQDQQCCTAAATAGVATGSTYVCCSAAVTRVWLRRVFVAASTAFLYGLEQSRIVAVYQGSGITVAAKCFLRSEL